MSKVARVTRVRLEKGTGARLVGTLATTTSTTTGRASSSRTTTVTGRVTTTSKEVKVTTRTQARRALERATGVTRVARTSKVARPRARPLELKDPGKP
jgi:hypothetical protein